MNGPSFPTNLAATVTIHPISLPPGSTWQPNVGDETLELLDRLRESAGLSDAGVTRLKDEAVGVLAKCINPLQGNAQSTGLVLGQVQSGKTMSFTTVAALARDNGYRIVIVITGTTTSLLHQSAGRLRQDLALEQVGRRWRHVPVEPAEPINRQMLTDVLDAWNDPNVPPGRRQTLLVTVMKNHKNLRKLRTQLETLAGQLVEAPTLIIDDEGDQASLNTKVRSNAESTVYREMMALKRCLPRHTFLQYTATPQALLLINIINVLSPRFCEALEPGQGYTGGQAFFVEQPQLVREIPPPEVGTRQSPLSEPPESLFEALRLYFLGVAAGLPTFKGGNRSMMVHPSVTTAEHARFHQWIVTTKETWKKILSDPATSVDRIELLDEFRASYQDLQQTVSDLHPFDTLAGRLLTAVRDAQVERVNAAAGKTPQIRWPDTYAWILVGGTAMDRGFTVRGLTVTYMPRGLGGGGQGNADTVQQRGRFFGYKRDYLGYCRVFLEGGVLQAFRDYVEHETDVRARLASHRDTGHPLADWPRAFLLDAAMKPTRDNVIDIDYQRRSIGQGWFTPRSPHLSTEAVEQNRRMRDAVRQSFQWADDEGHTDRTDFQRHSVARRVPLQQVFEEFLTGLRFAAFEDSQTFLTYQLLLRDMLDADSSLSATLYIMSKGRMRDRSVDENDSLPVLFQGAAPVSPKSKRGSVYPGDSEIKDTQAVTVQIHTLQVARQDGSMVNDVPTIALWLHATGIRNLVIQPQGVR
nr:Z1 domain-containing protein [Nitrosomonas nitrosa]